MKAAYKEELSSLVKGKVLFDEPLKNHTSFKIGGPAEVLVIPKSKTDLHSLVRYLYQQDIPYQVLGNGTNLLVADQGLSNVVIKLAQVIDNIKFSEDQIRVGAGVKLPRLAIQAASRGLSGLEFAVGLPATVGGAIMMNAGLGNNQTIGKLIVTLKTLSSTGEIKCYQKSELNFDYRTNKLQDKKEIILEAKLQLTKAKEQVIQKRMKQLLKSRKESQPLTLPNAGCVFKNPANDSAGRLIDQAGGKGLRIGDAQVSYKHANFIVNLGSATAGEVLELIAKVQQLVYDKFKVKLEREIIFLS